MSEEKSDEIRLAIQGLIVKLGEDNQKEQLETIKMQIDYYINNPR